MPSKAEKIKVGELRPSQLLLTFGVGAVVDLPHFSVMVMGLNYWDKAKASVVSEPRLLATVRDELGYSVTELRQVPIPDSGDQSNPFDESNKIGVPVIPFPGWMVCPFCKALCHCSSEIFKLQDNLFSVDKNQYKHVNCNKAKKPPTVFPVRFVVACRKGHFDEFPWHYFVHQGKSECRSQLTLTQYGVSGGTADVEVKCKTCGLSRRMSEAFGDSKKRPLPKCRGVHHHIKSSEKCKEPMKAMLVGASNSWFPVTLSVLSVPTEDNKLAQLVKDKWSTFEDTESSSELKVTIRTLRKTNLLGELENYKEEEIWQEIERQKQGQEEKTAPKSDIKKPEWELFTNKPRFKNDYLEFEIIEPPKDYQDYIEKIVLVEKLRVVRALIGFTRIEPPYDDLEEKERGEWSPISNKKPEWVPASDTKGEGIFIQFREDALKEWEDRILPSQYYEDIKLAHNQWRQERGLEVEIGFPGLRYMLLHSFSHALMRQFSIECGYSAASLAERIYSSSRDLKNYEGDCMGGVLIYTAAPDSEGTLGGLVSLGQALADQINKALEQMRLCSSDPLCSEHSPREGMVSLHVAACHACLFSPETSCEKGNRYLDRSLLMPNLKHLDLAFFGKN